MLETRRYIHIAFDFTREAETAEDAVFSAILQVREAIANAVLFEASPDYVGLTDTANMLEFSRQYMRQLVSKNINAFPSPIHSGAAAIYHFSDILNWLQHNSRRKVEVALYDVAILNMWINLCRQIESLTLPEEDSEFCIDQNIPEDVRAILKNMPQLAR